VVLSIIDTGRLRQRLLAWFPEREFFMRSQGQVRFIKVTSRLQIAAAGAAVLLLGGWGVSMGAVAVGHYTSRYERWSLLDREAKVEKAESRVSAYRKNLGGVVDQASAQHVRDLISDAVNAGAICVTGAPSGREGVILAPAVLDKVTRQMRIYSEESFGPVVGVIRVEDEAQAIRVANDSEYGLSAAVFTRDIARGLRVARQIQSGICHVNGPTVHDEPQMPFGGQKASGYGRFGGSAGIDAFTELRWITVETQPGHYPI